MPNLTLEVSWIGKNTQTRHSTTTVSAMELPTNDITNYISELLEPLSISIVLIYFR